MGKFLDVGKLNPQPFLGDLHRLELYDLGADPGAERDLSRSEAELTRWMARRLQQLRWSPVAAAGNETLSEEARETLRALGYLD